MAPAFMGMTPGDGENSYARNSGMQRALMEKCLPRFFDAIKSITLPDPDIAFRIADLGCASSRNAVANVEAIIEQVRVRYREGRMGDDMLEVQVFFQDLPTNDFNTLFKHLFSQPISEVEKAQNYMSAAVPGSFYDRLFPRSTINISMSFVALHWLSKVPDAVKDRASPAYNGGHIDIFRSSLATVQAYAEQADKDLDNFLASRAHEVARGGVIFLTFGIREKFLPCVWNPSLHLQEEVLNAMVVEGIVSEELRDSYNHNIYFRTLEEVNKQLDKYSSVFDVQTREMVRPNYGNGSHAAEEMNVYSPFLPDCKSPTEIVRARVMTNRGALGMSLEAHFGKDATDIFYERWEQAVCQLFTRQKSDTPSEPVGAGRMCLILCLRRK